MDRRNIKEKREKEEQRKKEKGRLKENIHYSHSLNTLTLLSSCGGNGTLQTLL
jgi:hypothetical protein